MTLLDDLAKKALELKGRGLTTGEIADELNLSRETVLWLLSRKVKTEKVKMAQDIFIDMRGISRGNRLRNIASALVDLIYEILDADEKPEPDVVVGIALGGVPLATLVADEIGCELSIVIPRKRGWEKGEERITNPVISQNFADPSGRNCVIVDDIITTGRTMEETIKFLKGLGANPMLGVVIVDKRGLNEIDGVAIRSLLRIGVV